jgi:hypothetical protein
MHVTDLYNTQLPPTVYDLLRFSNSDHSQCICHEEKGEMKQKYESNQDVATNIIMLEQESIIINGRSTNDLLDHYEHLSKTQPNYFEVDLNTVSHLLDDDFVDNEQGMWIVPNK